MDGCITDTHTHTHTVLMRITFYLCLFPSFAFKLNENFRSYNEIVNEAQILCVFHE